MNVFLPNPSTMVIVTLRPRYLLNRIENRIIIAGISTVYLASSFSIFILRNDYFEDPVTKFKVSRFLVWLR